MFKEPKVRFLAVRLMKEIEVLVVRNAGGRIQPILNDFAIFDSIIGATDVMIVHHTGQSAFPCLPPKPIADKPDKSPN